MPRNLIARANLVERLETRLRAESFPRQIMTAVVSIAGGIAFLCSAALLWTGYLLQLAVPDARSIGGVIRALSE